MKNKTKASNIKTSRARAAYWALNRQEEELNAKGSYSFSSHDMKQLRETVALGLPQNSNKKCKVPASPRNEALKCELSRPKTINMSDFESIEEKVNELQVLLGEVVARNIKEKESRHRRRNDSFFRDQKLFLFSVIVFVITRAFGVL